MQIAIRRADIKSGATRCTARTRRTSAYRRRRRRVSWAARAPPATASLFGPRGAPRSVVNRAFSAPLLRSRHPSAPTRRSLARSRPLGTCDDAALGPPPPELRTRTLHVNQFCASGVRPQASDMRRECFYGTLLLLMMASTAAGQDLLDELTEVDKPSEYYFCILYDVRA